MQKQRPVAKSEHLKWIHIVTKDMEVFELSDCSEDAYASITLWIDL